jgi:hypothetical protein
MRRLKHEPGAIRYSHVFRPMPSGTIELEDDPLVCAGARRFGSSIAQISMAASHLYPFRSSPTFGHSSPLCYGKRREDHPKRVIIADRNIGGKAAPAWAVKRPHRLLERSLSEKEIVSTQIAIRRAA